MNETYSVSVWCVLVHVCVVYACVCVCVQNILVCLRKYEDYMFKINIC